jgi:hypothetical protein
MHSILPTRSGRRTPCRPCLHVDVALHVADREQEAHLWADAGDTGAETTERRRGSEIVGHLLQVIARRRLTAACCRRSAKRPEVGETVRIVVADRGQRRRGLAAAGDAQQVGRQLGAEDRRGEHVGRPESNEVATSADADIEPPAARDVRPRPKRRRCGCRRSPMTIQLFRALPIGCRTCPGARS